MKTIILIGHTRSGSSAIIQAANLDKKVLSMGEIFLKDLDNKPNIFSKRHTNKSKKHKILEQIFLKEKGLAEISDIDLFNFIRETALKMNAKSLFFKIFNNQISKEALVQIFKQERPTIIFLARTRIDSSISHEKAFFTDRWVNVDTSNLKIGLDFDRILARSRDIDNWYETVYDLCVQYELEYSIFDYNKFLTDGYKYLSFFLKTNLIADIENNDMNDMKKRQDLNEHWTNKISNSEEILDKINKAGLKNYFLSNPVDDIISYK